MFRFKQFTIQQDRTAMKVCTDACVLGAWADVAARTADAPDPATTYLLDIGTGTGLLALMAAQRTPSARIDAVELDEAAAGQASENVAASPFANRIQVHRTAIQTYPTPTRPYDHILTNPPFYVNSLRSPNRAVSRALHADDLPFPDLLAAVRRLLAPIGTWWVLLPPPEMTRLVTLATKGSAPLLPARQLWLRHHAQKPVFRHLIGFQFGHIPTSVPDELCIYEPDGRTYSEGFRALLEPYYIIF